MVTDSLLDKALLIDPVFNCDSIIVLRGPILFMMIFNWNLIKVRHNQLMRRP